MKKDSFSISGFYRWSQCTGEQFRKACGEFAAVGTKFLSVDADTVKTFLQKNTLKELCATAAEYGLQFRDAHAVWGKGFDLNELESESQFAVHETILSILAESGIKTYTLHPGATCIYEGGWFGNEEHYRTIAAKAAERLLKSAEKYQITLAVENIFEPSTIACEVMTLVKKFSSPYLGLCLDCGHANLMEPKADRDVSKMVNYIRRAWSQNPQFTPGIPEFMLPEIVTVHVHDNDGLNDKHAVIDEQGTIDWKRYSALLKKAPRLISLQSEVELKPESELSVKNVVETLQKQFIIK